MLPGHRVVPASACVLTGTGLAEPALLYTRLPAHRHLQCHDPEGERQGWPGCNQTGQGWTPYSSRTAFGLSRRVTFSTANLGGGEHEYVPHVPRHSLNVSRNVSVHIPALRGLHSAYVSKYHTCVFPSVHTRAHASLHTEGAGTVHTSSLCACALGHLGIWMCLHLFIYSTNVYEVHTMGQVLF